MDIFSQIAKANTTTEEKVRTEISSVISAAFRNTDPKVQNNLAALFPEGSNTSPEEFIEVLGAYVLAMNKLTS